MGDALWDRVDVLADPCESNFAVTKFVAEPFNFLSAFGLILAGCNAMHQSRKYNFETRFMVLGFSVVVMGASSAFFHATLYQRAKSWEEMAIVWAAFGWICVLSQMNSPTNQTPCVAMVLSLGGGLWILQMGFDPQIILMGSRIFLNLYCAIGVYLLNDCVEKYCNLPLLLRRNKEYNFNPHPSMLKLQLMARWQVACAATAALVWILEVSFCGSLKNFQPHALYHLLIGLSCHYGLQFAMALRQSILHKAPPATSWSLGGLLGCVVPTEVPSRAMGAQLRWLLKIAGVDHLDNV
eukprot:CAMPEP_0114510040 /NCGR_PEP_ID=MMETSP0109-20121206/13560_1 /TAXON_ID=29199 /ORGANISM="Chlorarachnion reptans, Strain CCCM449" /LENGTH=294 /DNA_ID=CAMNT_0001689291 /DNA_START=364 /DNA_END=1248 /DNA_ORIENTATION=-